MPLEEPVVVPRYEDLVAMRLGREPAQKSFDFQGQPLAGGISGMDENISVWDLEPFVGIVGVRDADEAHVILSVLTGGVDV